MSPCSVIKSSRIPIVKHLAWADCQWSNAGDSNALEVSAKVDTANILHKGAKVESEKKKLNVSKKRGLHRGSEKQALRG